MWCNGYTTQQSYKLSCSTTKKIAKDYEEENTVKALTPSNGMEEDLEEY
jgi:hypothetical protein